MKLNGWRRLGSVLVVAWIVGALTVSLLELQSNIDGYFVYGKIPTGTVIQGNQATLPNGQVVQLHQHLDGREVKPWEINWDNEPEIPRTKVIRWSRLLGFGLALPCIAWLLIEASVSSARWVACGFKDGNVAKP